MNCGDCKHLEKRIKGEMSGEIGWCAIAHIPIGTTTPADKCPDKARIQ